jgi:hypothetical protein
MPRSVTVVFDNGETRVYTDVPDDVTPDQIEDLALRDFPGRTAREIMMGVDIAHKSLRDAIATRTATMEDLDRIAGEFGYRISDEDRGAFQNWIDYAASNPTVRIPDDIFTPPASRTEAVGLGVGQGLSDILGTLTGAQESVLRFFGGTPENAGSVRGRLLFELPELFNAFSRQPNVMRAQEQRPNYFTGGEIVGQVAGTAPLIAAGGGGLAALGGRLATAAPRAGAALQSFGRAVQSGGIGVRAPTATTSAVAPVAATRTGRVALRVGGGATAGAAGAALTDEDVSTEALIGGAIPIIGTIGRRGAGTVYDFLRGRLGEVRAGAVMRNLIADKSEEIIAALRSATDDVRQSTAQFLAERGLLTPEIAAATRIAQASAFGKPLETQALQRAAARRAQQAELRGGETAAEAAENVNAMRQAVREETDPLLQEAMRAGDVGRTQIVPAELEAARLSAQSDEAGARAADLYRIADDQTAVLNTMFQNPAFFTLDGPAARVGQIADQAGRRADEAIDLQRNLRDEAARLRAVADDLRAQGYAPIDISGVVGNLRSLAREALPNSNRRRLFSGFADVLQARAAEQGGVIDAQGLHLAKREMGEFVSSVLGQADPSAISRGTAMMTGATQKMINDAIDEASGPGAPFSAFNRAFSSGMQRVEQQDFARQLADLTPQRFERVMADGDPDFVSGFFPGKFRVSDVLPPELLDAARQRNRQVAADLDVAEFGLRDLPRELRGGFRTGAQARVEGALAPGLTPRARALFNVTGRIPNISGAGFATEQVARDYSQQMAENAMRNLVPGLAQPSEALRLVGVRGANERTANLINAMTPMQRAITAQTLQNMISQPSLEYVAPSETVMPDDPIFMGFQTGPNGGQIPIYAPARVQR